MVFEQRCARTVGSIALLLITVSCLGSYALAQDQSPAGTQRICIEEPQKIPASSPGAGVVSIRIEWNVECATGLLPLSTYDSFVVWCSPNPGFPAEGLQVSESVTDRNFYVFDNKDSTGVHWFRVFGFDGDTMAAKSIAMNYVGSSGTTRPISWRPGYKFLELLEFATFIDQGGLTAWQKSSSTGKFAFDLIGLFFLLGTVIWISRTARTLRSTKVFLVNKDVGGRNECRVVMEQLECETLSDPDRKTVRRLVDKRMIRGFFQGMFRWFDKLTVWEFTVRYRAKGHPEGKRFRDIPSVRIILSAVVGLQDKSELEKAMEVRILAEEEELRKRSFLDVLWALGVTAPLVGLFGTVTGISQSFEIIHKATADVDSRELTSLLAGGINEALYTTICGLIVGILFMLAYYWYNYKLERIHAIWVVFAAEFLDRLKHGIQPGPQSPPAQTPQPPQTPQSDEGE